MLTVLPLHAHWAFFLAAFKLSTSRNARLGADGGLQEERQLLVEEQKLCRARARKFSLETNRRRKALEERRKQWDVQEQRLRQNVLQQRRQRVQDATERFQRAHLPPSQRYRQPFRRNVPNIEDALSQIQDTLSSYSRQSSFLSSSSNLSRSCTPSPKPPTVSKSSHHQVLSAVEAYTKLLQEQSVTSLRNSQQTEKTQEKQQDHSPQTSQLSNCRHSESLSSKDSLDDEDPDHNTKNCSYSSFFRDSEKSHPDLRKLHYLYPTSDLTSFSAMMRLGDNLSQSRKLHEPKQEKPDDSEGLDNETRASKTSWGFTSVEQTPQTETQPALHNCNLLTLCEIISGDPEHFEVNSPRNSPNDNTIIKNGVSPSNTALQPSCPKQEALLDLRQQRVYDDKQLKHPSATEILLHAKNGNSKDVLYGAPPKPNIVLNDSTTDNASQEGTLQQTGKEIHSLSPQKEPSASINNLNKVFNSESKTEKPINTALLQHACLSNIHSDAFKCLKCPEQEVQKIPVSSDSLKGFLRNSPNIWQAMPRVCTAHGHLIFAEQVALAIRDSVELTRAKTKDVEVTTVKKKLRWFDEVHVEKEDKKQDVMKQMKSKAFSLCQSNNNLEDHQLSLTTVSGASKPGPSMTPTASTGYHFTKQAWADVGVQVALPQEQADEVKVPCSSTRTGGPKVPRRERSTRAGAGTVSSRARKGTVIRPQSATEVSQIAKSQGKIIVPHPPPRMESVEEKTPDNAKTPYGTDHASVICKQAPAAEQALHMNNSPYTHHAIRTDSTVMYTPLPPSYTCPVSEGNAKGTPSSGHQDTQGCSQRRGMSYREQGLCLDCTPTDEEISQLWHGVRSALATKDEKNKLKRQALESGRGVRKPCAEQSKQSSGSGNRRVPQFLGVKRESKMNSLSGNHSHSTTQTSDNCAAVHAHKFMENNNKSKVETGFESAARLHLAEGHAEGLLEERDIVAVMETVQTQRSGTVQRRSQQQGLTTISLEEQKILLSLDRLNHQLFCVQEHMGGSAGTRGLVLVDGPSTREAKVTSQHRNRASSANNHSRYQRKF
ncbi:Centrosomal protein of 126 kDa [Collichthys lucidus]|uniref:Centrosomal protein of 126 kDa n=1 Tax=Collichthys lucidus TaxID=240159 RepID=A0A4U5UZ69_COLLU|nr:Centrosomal protein of 126 kDa [Collichthys lucidus]